METKPLLYGLIGFFAGGLLVSIAATTFEKAEVQNQTDHSAFMSMNEMSGSLAGKRGDDYDKAFIENMIAHHEGAVAMAKQSAANAKHDEIKDLSRDIITAQEAEISEMKHWQQQWGYSSGPESYPSH